MQTLYVITRKDLSFPQQAVQSGHALAQWLLDNPENDWQNQRLIYLVVDTEKELNRLKSKLTSYCLDHSYFCEPDFEDKLTAIACREPIFSKLKKLGD